MSATPRSRTTPEGILRFFFSEPSAAANTPAILLDRDGVINERILGGYVAEWTQFRFVEGMASQLAELSKLGLPMLVISNQAGVGKGLVTLEALAGVTQRFVAALRQQGARIDAVYYCPHAPDARCQCRKPAGGLFRQAAQDWRIELESSVFIGDSLLDAQAAESVRARAILIASEGADASLASASHALRLPARDILQLAATVRLCLQEPARLPREVS